MSNGYDSLEGETAGGWNLSLTSIYDEVNNALSYTCNPPYFVMEWCLYKHREKFMHVCSYTDVYRACTLSS
jgi:hypothetical protein